MDHFSDQLSARLARKPPRPAVCPEHGDYESKHVFGRIWANCPVCEAAEREVREREEAVERRAESERVHRRMLDAASIPPRFVGCGFDNFVCDSDDKQRAVTVARDFVENFPAHAKVGAALIFAGSPGTGKSHLAGAILQALLSPYVRYVTCMDMMRMIRDTWRRSSDRSESDVLSYLAGLDLLVIDEVGMQYGTDSEQNILFDVLDRRYRDLKPVVILTNQDKAGFKSFVGERIYDRLRETAQWVPFAWPSYRANARKAA